MLWFISMTTGDNTVTADRPLPTAASHPHCILDTWVPALGRGGLTRFLRCRKSLRSLNASPSEIPLPPSLFLPPELVLASLGCTPYMVGTSKMVLLRVLGGGCRRSPQGAPFAAAMRSATLAGLGVQLSEG